MSESMCAVAYTLEEMEDGYVEDLTFMNDAFVMVIKGQTIYYTSTSKSKYYH